MTKKDFTRHPAIFTELGGLAVRLLNKTGNPSMKGMLVRLSLSTPEAFQIISQASERCIGVVYSEGIPDGDSGLVVVAGIAEVLLVNSTASTMGYWVYTSEAAMGRADATLSAPPGGGVPELTTHTRQVGYSMESKEAGTDVLCKVLLQLK